MGNPWDNWRNGQITDPDAFDDDGTPKHAYCSWCGTVTKGPHTGQVWPHTPEGKPLVQAADNDRYYTVEEAEAEHKLHNVSGSICPTCYDKTLAEWRAQHAARKAAQQNQSDQTA